MLTSIDHVLSPATGRFRWLIAAIFAAPMTGYVSTAIVAVTAVLEALRFKTVIAAIRASRAAQVTGCVLLVFCLIILATDLAHAPAKAWRSLQYLLPVLGPLLLFARLSEMNIRYHDIGRLALTAASLTIVAAALQFAYYTAYLKMPTWRPALWSGNVLFVSGMFVPLLFLGWLGFERRGARGRLFTAAVFILGALTAAVVFGGRIAFFTILLLTPVSLIFAFHRTHVSRRQKLHVLLGALAMTVLIVALIPVAAPMFEQRVVPVLSGLWHGNLSAIDDASALARLQNWQAGWRAFCERPLTGYGFRMDAEAVAPFLPAEAIHLPTVHQQYLSFALAAGIAGLIAGVAYLALPLINVLLDDAKRRCRDSLYASFALAAPILLNGTTDTIFDDLRIQGFYSVMIVLLLAARPETERARRA